MSNDLYDGLYQVSGERIISGGCQMIHAGRIMGMLPRVLATLIAAGFWLVSCGPLPKPVPPAPPVPPTPPVATWLVNAVACADAGPIPFACRTPISGATIQMDGPDGYISKPGDGAGYAVFTLPANFPDSDVIIDAPGYETARAHIDVTGTHDSSRHNIIVLRSAHMDPSTIPLGTLAAIRGAMWTARLDIPYGPRPGQADNILALDFYQLYDAATRVRMLHQYKSQGYLHAVTGPVAGSDCYHGKYPCRTSIPTQDEWDAYLDTIQEWWDQGIVPVFFAKPDGWERAEHAADMDALDALFSQPRAQRLLRIVVYPGWEPSGDKYGWANATYVTWVQRGARVFPDALRCLHTVSDLDAPTGQDDDHLFPRGEGNAISWQRVAPYIHVWLVQVGGYVGGGQEVPSANFVSEFKKLWPDFRHKFGDGGSGWPTSSAWGLGQRVRVCYAEGASYGNFWWNWNEQHALDLGDLAMAQGADCYLDGGTVDVPVRR